MRAVRTGRRRCLALAGLLVMAGGLSGCLDEPALRERDLSTHQACVARCNRNDNVCGESAAGNINPTPELRGTGMCQRELRECLHRCGDPG